MLRTDHISWSVVERFILAPRGTARLTGFVELSDGSRVWTQGIGSWYRFARRSAGAEAVIDEMNELLPIYRAARIGGGSRPSASEPAPDGSMAVLVPAGNGRYRTWHRAVLHMIVMTPGIALCVPLGASVLASTNDLESLLFGLAFLLGGLALAVALWRVIGACLLVHDEGVVVRTEGRSRSWTWEELAEFFVPIDSSMLFVRTADGAEVPVPGVSGLRPALFPRARDRFTRLAAELNLRLEGERTPPGERPSEPVPGPR